jgi:hypothetical protein
MPLVEQELLTLDENLSLPPVFIGVRVFTSFLLSIICLLAFSPLILVIALSALLLFTDSVYPFAIFFVVHLFIMNNNYVNIRD